MADIKSKWAQEWQRENPVLRNGEPGFDRTSGRLKIGDGRTHWNSLSYLRDSAVTDAAVAAVAGQPFTRAALAGFTVTGGIHNTDGTANITKRLRVTLTADGTDIDNLTIEDA